MEKNKKELESIFKVAPVGIGIVKDRILTGINERICEITGYEKEELIGSSSRILYPDQEEYEFVGVRKYRQIAEKGTGTVETKWKRKDGSIIDVLLSSTPIDQNDHSHGVTFTALDITDRKQAEAELIDREQRFKALYDNAPLPYQSLDENGCFIDVNPAWLEILGHKREEVIGKSFSEFLHPDWVPDFHDNFARFKLIEHVSDIQYKIKHEDGHYLHVSFEGRVAYHQDGSFKQTYCVFKDITEQIESEEKMMMLAGLLKTSPASIMIHDFKGNVLFANQHMYRLHGYLSGEIEDFNLQLLSDQETLKKIPERMQEIREKGQASFEEYHIKKDGNRFPLQVSTKSIPWQGKEAVLSIAVDMSSQKQAEKELEKTGKVFKLFFDQAAVGVAQVSRDGSFLKINKQFSEITGYSIDELMSSNFRDITHPDDLHKEDTYMQQIMAHDRESYEIEKRFIHKEGHIVWVKLYSNVIRNDDGSVLYATAVIIDTTDQKKAEEALIYAKALADESNRIKSEMIKNVTHELRTPLTAVIGFSDQLLHTNNGNLDETQEKYIGHIHQSGENLLSIVNVMLDFANLEHNISGSMELQPVNASNVVHDTTSLLIAKASKKNVQINITVDNNLDTIVADKAKLESILYNLVENAIKFTDNTGTVTIRASLGNDNTALFSIKDNGIGIEKEKLDNIFEAFTQVDGSMSRKYGGTGLGLALVRKLIEMHGGSINVESEPGKGSNFVFEIPIGPI